VLKRRNGGLTFELVGFIFGAFAAAVALCVVRFGLSGVSAVFALLDRSSFGGNMLKRAVCDDVR